MGPRRRTRTSQAASTSAASLTIADLPDGVLVHCLGFLDFAERCARGPPSGPFGVSREAVYGCQRMPRGRRAALPPLPSPLPLPHASLPPPNAARPACRLRSVAPVSRRFAALCCSPKLLREVGTASIRCLPALHALSAWLARHGQHMRRFTFVVGQAAEEQAGSLIAATASSLADWLPALRSLRCLSLSGSPLAIPPAISGLTALQSLQLTSYEICFAAAARLPTAITRLVVEIHGLQEYDGREMPRQASRQGCCVAPWLPLLLLLLHSPLLAVQLSQPR